MSSSLIGKFSSMLIDMTSTLLYFYFTAILLLRQARSFEEAGLLVVRPYLPEKSSQGDVAIITHPK